MSEPGRDEAGIVLWQVALAVVVLAALAAVAGPRLAGLREKAVSVSLTSSVTAAARALQAAYDAGAVSADSVNQDGSPKPALIARLGAGTEGVDWRAAWAYDDEDEAGTVRVQFLHRYDATHGANRAASTPTADPASPPAVVWLAADFAAARVHARAGDGSWACALVIHAADTYALHLVGLDRQARNLSQAGELLHPLRSRATSDTSIGITWEEAADRLMRGGGLWYDSGAEAVRDGLFDCSPVNMSGSGHPTSRNGRARLPPASGPWELRQSIASTYSVPADGVDVDGALTGAP